MSEEHDDTAADAARLGFRDALIRADRMHGNFDELEVAACRYCQILRRQGCSPEGTVINAKRVIEEAIDDHNRPVAERAVLICIQEYYRV